MSSSVNSSNAEKVDEKSINNETLVTLRRAGFIWSWTWLAVPITAIIFLALTLTYLVYRIYCIAHAEQNENWNLGLAWFFVVLEIVTLSSSMMLYLTRVFAWKKRVTPHLHLHGNDVPLVDVVITCCGEDDAIILNTVRAASALDWPQECLRVMLLDDGRSEVLAAGVEKLKASHPNVFYTSREKPAKADFKAGNLNHGFKFAETLPNGASPFIAGLDADMIPKPVWLRTLMPHLLNDSKMAMLCPPQHFYNVPLDDLLDQDLNVFYRQREPINDALGAADCWGSGWIARRKALEDMGGIPTDTLSEDTGSSMILLGHGWKTLFTDEAIQYGQVPDTYLGHVKQRTRWNLGNIQNAFKFRLHIGGPFAAKTMQKLTLPQRVAGINYDFGALVQFLIWISILGMPLALLSGYPFVVYSNTYELQWLLRLASLFQIANGVHCAVTSPFAPYRVAFRHENNDIWMVPYHMLTTYRHYILPRFLGGGKLGFTSTGTFADNLEERNASKRAPLPRRLKALLLDNHVLVHVLFIAACTAGIILAFVRCFAPSAGVRSAYSTESWILGTNPNDDHSGAFTTKAKLAYLLTRIGWPPVIWYSSLVAMLTPISYAVAPPAVPGLETLLRADEVTGVLYPTEKAEGSPMTWFGRLKDHSTVVVSVYCVFTFVVSWFI